MVKMNSHLTAQKGATIDCLLESLADGRLARRIADAARMARAQHMAQKALMMRSDVEAEDSTK